MREWQKTTRGGLERFPEAVMQVAHQYRLQIDIERLFRIHPFRPRNKDYLSCASDSTKEIPTQVVISGKVSMFEGAYSLDKNAKQIQQLGKKYPIRHIG